MRNINRQTVVLVLATTLLLSVVQAASIASLTPTGYYDQMLSKLKTLKTYQATINETMVLQPTTPGAKPRTINSKTTIAYESPNLFSFSNEGLMGGGLIVSDGKKEIVYSAFTQEYAIVPPPADVLNYAFSGFSGKKVSWVSENTETVDGAAVYELHGKMVSQRGTTLVTLDVKRADLLPSRALIVIPTISSPTGNGLQITRTEVFNDQILNRAIQATTFKVSPPDGATKVNSITDLSSGMGGGGID